MIFKDFIIYYSIFCLTTSVCTMYIEYEALQHLKYRMTKAEKIFFYFISFFLSYIFAPMFFIIYLFYSKQYKEGLIKAINDNNDKKSS